MPFWGLGTLPSWGGEDYDRHSNLHMYMNNQDVGDIFYKLNKHCHYFVMKAPSNFDSKDFARRSQMTQIYDRNFVISQKKHTYWKLFVYVTNSTYCISPTTSANSSGSVLPLLSPRPLPRQVHQAALRPLQGAQPSPYPQGGAPEHLLLPAVVSVHEVHPLVPDAAAAPLDALLLRRAVQLPGLPV